jgi:II/X family phage/plasmid replication protein
MLDWLTFTVPYAGRSIGDQYLKASWESGEVEPAFNRALSLKGSFDSGVMVQALGDSLTISGNPVKWLTGQNVVGPDNIHRLVEVTFREVFKRLDMLPCIRASRAIFNGDAVLNRVDCTFAYHIGNPEDVRAWLMAMSEACHVRYRGRGFYDDGMCSLMFGLSVKPGKKPKGSSYSSFKFYDKAQELKKRPLLCPLEFRAELHEIASGHVRAEALYRRRELAGYNLDKVKTWKKETSLELNRKWMQKMEISPNVPLNHSSLLDLPTWLRSTYLHWMNGQDLRDLLPRHTFYRHRKALQEFGVDISVTRHGSPATTAQVVPLIRYIEAKPACPERSEDLFWQILQAA